MNAENGETRKNRLSKVYISPNRNLEMQKVTTIVRAKKVSKKRNIRRTCDRRNDLCLYDFDCILFSVSLPKVNVKHEQKRRG